MNEKPKFNVVVDENQLAAIVFALRDKVLSFETSLVEESAKDQPDREELAFLGYEFHRTYNTMLAVESVIERNKLTI